MRRVPRLAPLASLALAICVQAAQLRVDLEGLDGEMARNARAHLSVESYTGIASLSETNIRVLHARAPLELRAALEPFGYYDPVVEATLDRDGRTWVAHYRVTLGEPVRITELDLQIAGDGAEEPALRAALASSRLRQGEVLRHADYESLKRALRATALEHGYRDAVLTKNLVEVDPAARSARVALHLETGPRYRFGELRFEQEILSPDVLRRYAAFEPGHPFDARQLVELQYALYDTEFFAIVQVEPDEPVGDRIPVTIRAEPRAKHRYRVGAGFGTDTGARLSLGWANRRVNRLGHRAAIGLTLSEPKKELEGQYIVPLLDPAHDRRTFAARAVEEQLGDTLSRKTEFIASDTRELAEWQRQLYLRLTHERTELPEERLSATQLVPGTTWTRTRTDDPIFPLRGSFVSADVHGSAEALSGGSTFLRLRIDTRLVRPLHGGRLIARASGGTSFVSQFSQLPSSERFFAGGDQSVRGFDLNSLGPRDADGQVIGGHQLLTGSFEYERRVRGPWGLAVFVDAGNAFDTLDGGVEAGAGVGLRYRSPLGMLRLDLAEPLTAGGDGLHFHFSFGPEL